MSDHPLVAIRAHRYAGKLREPGDSYVARTGQDARLMKALQWAIDAAVVVPTPAPEPEPAAAPKRVRKPKPVQVIEQDPQVPADTAPLESLFSSDADADLAE